MNKWEKLEEVLDESMKYREAEKQGDYCQTKAENIEKGQGQADGGGRGSRNAVFVNLARVVRPSWDKYYRVFRGANLDLEVTIYKPLARDQKTKTEYSLKQSGDKTIGGLGYSCAGPLTYKCSKGREYL